MQAHPEELIKAKINGETAKIPWKELLRFFAGGYAIEVTPDEDLINVATLFAKDKADDIKALMDAAKVRAVPDETARDWLDTDTMVWAVVVSPWVLVQNPKHP